MAVMARPAVGPAPFGSRLAAWRRARGLSQLALAAAADTTARHVSFLETGRSRPSPDMVLRLCDALDVPLRDRNALLEAAGLAAVFGHEPLSAEDLRPFRATIERLLRAHDPYPAVVVDRHWNVVAANDAAALFGDRLVGENLVRRYAASNDAIANWPQVARAALARLRRQLREAPHDDELRALVDLVQTAVADLPPGPAAGDELVICPHFRFGDRVIRTITVAARFQHPLDVTLAELCIELTYPHDDDAEAFFRAIAASRTAVE
jgi:transcriptional regulator with XRE-family HTH domain